MVGIDLGTTNSCVVVIEGGRPSVIPNRDGARTTPSVVAITDNNERLVGQAAKRQALTNPENTVYGVKRLLGRRFKSAEVQSAANVLPYRVVEATNGDAHIRLNERNYSPPEIAAIILKELKSSAEAYLGETIEEVIITVPDHFNDSQRRATKDAGDIAGLNVVRILNEPTAASLAYGINETCAQRFAVYDLGGGTFDISIVELSDGIYQVLATDGDTYLGGEDFDQIVMNWLIREFSTQHGIDLSSNRIALQRLKRSAERAKCELSTQVETVITIPFIAGIDTDSQHLNLILKRSEFEKMIEPLLRKTQKCCEDALRNAGLSASDIDFVIPVGGQTRSPIVLETIGTIFGTQPKTGVNADEVVSIGAAIQTGIMQGDITDQLLLDVTPHTLGVATQNGQFTPLISKNSTIPTKKNKIFTTVTDQQTEVEVHVLQGESDSVSENTSLGRFLLSDITPAPTGVPQIQVTFEVDVNGIVQVSAMDQSSGHQKHVIVHAVTGLSQSELESARRHCEQASLTKSQLNKYRNTLADIVTLVSSIKESYALLSDRLSQEERSNTMEIIAAAEQMSTDSHDELKSLLQKLESTASKLGQMLLRG